MYNILIYQPMTVCQDDEGSLLTSELPTIGAEDAGASNGTGSGEIAAPVQSQSVMTFKFLGIYIYILSHMKITCIYIYIYYSAVFLRLMYCVLLRLTFPSISSNTSVMAILPQFIDVLGRKLDKIRMEQDCSYLCRTYCTCMHDIFNVLFAVHETDLRYVQDRVDALKTSQSVGFLGRVT